VQTGATAMGRTLPGAPLSASARAAAWLWLACLQFFVCEQVARLGWLGSYSFRRNYISDLGALGGAAEGVVGSAAGAAAGWSPLHAVMNGSFGAQSVLIAGGALLWSRRATPGWPGWVARVYLLLSAVGLLVVATNPEDVAPRVHVLGAELHFACASLGMLFWGLGAVLYRRGEAAAAAILAGSVAIFGDLVLALGHSAVLTGLGAGLMERCAAYPLPLWLAYMGWRQVRKDLPRTDLPQTDLPQTDMGQTDLTRPHSRSTDL
jgi:hypothetical membrane protein